jgi:OOP family OmpA-OmpF porin
MTRNKKALIAAVLGAAALTASTVSVAQFRLAQPDQERGTYLGISAGRAEYKVACDAITIPCDNSDSAWRFFAGHQFNRHLAVELGFANLGAASGSDPSGLTMRYEASAWDVSGVVYFPLSPSFSLLGRLGMHRTEVETAGNVGRFQGTANEKGGGLVYGFGGQFTFGRSLGLRLEWMQYGNVGGGAAGEDDISTFTAGVLWKF